MEAGAGTAPVALGITAPPSLSSQIEPECLRVPQSMRAVVSMAAAAVRQLLCMEL